MTWPLAAAGLPVVTYPTNSQKTLAKTITHLNQMATSPNRTPIAGGNQQPFDSHRNHGDFIRHRCGRLRAFVLFFVELQISNVISMCEMCRHEVELVVSTLTSPPQVYQAWHR